MHSSSEGNVLIEQHWLFESKIEEKEILPGTGDEITYRPWGVVTCIQWPLDRPDGEVFAVVYRSPSGQLYKAWKQPQEIDLQATTKREWAGIHDLIIWDDASPDGAMLPGSAVLH